MRCLILLFYSLVGSSLQESLRIGTFQVAPFTSRRQACRLDDGKRECRGNAAYEGYCVDLMHSLAHQLQSDFRIEIRRGVGERQEDGTWDGLVGDLNSSAIDIAVAPIIVSEDLEKVVDFSPPFLTSGLSVMIKKPNASRNWHKQSSLNPYSPVTWIAIALLEIMSIATSAILYSHMTRVEKPKAKFTLRFYIFLFSLLVWLLCTLFLVGSIVQHGYSTSSSGSRTEDDNSVESQNDLPYLESIEDLVNQEEVKYGMQRGGTTHTLLQRSNNSLHQKMLKKIDEEDHFVSRIVDGIDKVRSSEGRFAFILQDVANAYENSHRPCDTRKLGSNLINYHYAIATRKGSEWSEKVRVAVNHLNSTGQLGTIYNRWFVHRSQCEREGNSQMSEAERVVTYAIYGMILGIAISIIASLISVHLERKKDKYPVRFTDEIAPMNA